MPIEECCAHAGPRHHRWQKILANPEGERCLIQALETRILNDDSGINKFDLIDSVDILLVACYI